MADMSFDVVIVGGQKAGVTAMYLAKYGGMSVGLFEERHELFTGFCQEELAAIASSVQTAEVPPLTFPTETTLKPFAGDPT